MLSLAHQPLGRAQASGGAELDVLKAQMTAVWAPRQHTQDFLAVVLLSSCGCHSVLAGGRCDLLGESEVGVLSWPGHWAGPGDSHCSPHVLPAALAGWHWPLGTGRAGASGVASPGHGQCSRLPCRWPHPFSWQVQRGRGPHLEHTQLHQHLRVCGRAAERARGGDAGHDVSDRRRGLRRGCPGPWLL